MAYLHLLKAMASWLEAKRQRKKWVAVTEKGEAAANEAFGDMQRSFQRGSLTEIFLRRARRKIYGSRAS